MQEQGDFEWKLKRIAEEAGRLAAKNPGGPSPLAAVASKIAGAGNDIFSESEESREEQKRLKEARERQEAERRRREEERLDPARLLEAGGYSRALAGPDFNNICEAVKVARSEGLGLLLVGGVGCGKSTAARALLAGFGRSAEIIPALRLAAWCQRREKEDEGDDEDYETPFAGGAGRDCGWLLDDFGAELPASNYGVIHEYGAEFIINVYDKETYARGIITTNLNAKDLGEKYGERVMSRIRECFVTVKMGGGDKRKRAPVFG